MVTLDEKWVAYNIVLKELWSKSGKVGQTRANGREGSAVNLMGIERDHLLLRYNQT